MSNINTIRKYFSLKENTEQFEALTKDEKILVKEGHNLVKKYELKKAKMDNENKESKKLMALIDDVNVDKSYDEENRKYMETLVRYCVKKAGYDVTNFQIKNIQDPNIHNKTIFKETFQAILAQVMTPIVPALVSAAFMEMADVANIGFGDTAKFDVRSNDTFFVTNMAEGVLTGTVQRLYNKELTVNPEPYNIKTTVNWYHVASNLFDFGYFVDRIGYSFANYVSEMVIQAITKDITTNIAASSPYFTNGLTTAKWTKLIDELSGANGNARVSAFGSLSALSAVIPTQTGLQQGLGERWTSVGYLESFMGTPLIRVPQILLPNTVNTTALFGIPNDTIWLFAEGGYKPVKLVFEGQAITKDFIPTESVDKEMGVEVTMRIGQTFVAASKYGAITGVTLS